MAPDSRSAQTLQARRAVTDDRVGFVVAVAPPQGPGDLHTGAARRHGELVLGGHQPVGRVEQVDGQRVLTEKHEVPGRLEGGPGIVGIGRHAQLQFLPQRIETPLAEQQRRQVRGVRRAATHRFRQAKVQQDAEVGVKIVVVIGGYCRGPLPVVDARREVAEGKIRTCQAGVAHGQIAVLVDQALEHAHSLREATAPIELDAVVVTQGH